MEEVRPTHAQLLALRDQIAVASQGMRLLKSKRDALLLEFLDIVDTTLTLSDRLVDALTNAQYTLELARGVEGDAMVHSAALATSGEVLVDMGGYKVMGVAVPVIEKPSRPNRTAFTRGYGPTGVSARVDEAGAGFEKAIGSILEFAESETRLRRLGAEIAKTNRRVNALEQLRIPELQAQVRYIEQTLDERAREELFRLKKVKKKIERNAGH